MSEKRFTWNGDILFDSLELRELGNCLEARDIADLLNELNDENKELKQINHSVFKSIGNRIKFWKELAETNRSNSVLQRVVDDLKDLYKLKKGD